VDNSSKTTERATTDGSFVDRYFKITARGSTLGREVRGGFVTFFTMAYIIVLNPIILLGAQDGSGQLLAGGDFAGIAATTALAAGVLTILMGVVANFPLALATGLGLNAFVAYSIASGMTWADAMGLVVLEGLIILALVRNGRSETFPSRQTVLRGGDSILVQGRIDQFRELQRWSDLVIEREAPVLKSMVAARMAYAEAVLQDGSPLVGELATLEIVDGASVSELAPYRVERFTQG